MGSRRPPSRVAGAAILAVVVLVCAYLGLVSKPDADDRRMRDIEAALESLTATSTYDEAVRERDNDALKTWLRGIDRRIQNLEERHMALSETIATMQAEASR